MNLFRVKEYYFHNKKIPSGKKLRFCLVSDLHGLEHGAKNGELVQKLRQIAPDAILIPGDMVIRKDPKTCPRALAALRQMEKIAPVFYSPGNHETLMGLKEETEAVYEKYVRRVRGCGIYYLQNESMETEISGVKVTFHGLELPAVYYKKPFSPTVREKNMRTFLGECQKESLQILLAHNPRFMDTYFSWGADLTVSGHYHGGILRLGQHMGALSPQFHPFPKYCCGDFRNGEQAALVSAGLGEHTLPVRIHNPRELLVITLGNQKNLPEHKGELHGY
ncbi:MAG: metallophosphoesterase [Eubacteriales bacterium]|nr:metallophosphoesterase [Eubacteriales bacterium]